MSELMHLLVRLRSGLVSLPRDENGAVATEYAILITGIALVIIIGVGAFGGALNDWFNGLADQIGL